MSYSYRLESRFFFWILSVLITSLLFSVLYFFKIFGDKLNTIFPLTISLILLVFLFFVGLTSTKTTTKFYSLIDKGDEFSKIITKIEIDESEKNIEKMVKRFKEVFYNIDLSEREKSISIIQRTVGFSKESANKVYLILRNINFTKTVLIISGLLISVIIYIILTKVNFFIFLKETVYFPIAISLLIFLVFIFESVLTSKLPTRFYLNLVNINKKQLTENKSSISSLEKNISLFFDERENKREKLKNVVTSLTEKGIKKQDILEIIQNRKESSTGLKDLIMQANEKYSESSSKASFQEIKQTMDNIVQLYENIRATDQKILDLKKDIDTVKEVQETIEKINSDDWDYYRNIKFDLKNKKERIKDLSDDIVSKIHHVSELKVNRAEIIRSLYQSFLPYKEDLTKDKVSSILISKGYSYEIVIDLLDEFKKNNIDLDKNNKSFQDKVVSKINRFYDTFKD